MLMFRVQSLGSIQDPSQTADAGDVPRRDWGLSVVGTVAGGSSRVRSRCGGCRAGLWSPDSGRGHGCSAQIVTPSTPLRSWHLAAGS